MYSLLLYSGLKEFLLLLILLISRAYSQQFNNLNQQTPHSLGLPQPILLIAPCPEFPEVVRSKTGGRDNEGEERSGCCGIDFGCCCDCCRFDCNLCC